MSPNINNISTEDVTLFLHASNVVYSKGVELDGNTFEVDFDLSKLIRTGESKIGESGEGANAIAIRGTASIPVYIMFPTEDIAELDHDDFESIRQFILQRPDLLSDLIYIVSEEDPDRRAQMLQNIETHFRKDLFLGEAKVLALLDETELNNYQTCEFTFNMPAMLKAIIPRDESEFKVRKEDQAIIDNIIENFGSLEDVIDHIHNYLFRVDQSQNLEEFYNRIECEAKRRLTNSEIELIISYVQEKADFEMINQANRFIIFEWESRILQKLKNVKNVIKPIDRVTIVDKKGRKFSGSVTIFIEGVTLDQSKTSVSKLLSSGAAMKLATVIDDMHASGVIHRDIKPNNIVLDPNGEMFILDLGAAWPEDYLGRIDMPANYTPPFSPYDNAMLANSKFYPNKETGEPGYVGRLLTRDEHEEAKAIMKSINYGHTVDVFGLARTLMALENWEPKLGGEVYAKATAFDPKDRYQSAREFITALMKAYGTGELKTSRIFPTRN